MNTRDLEAFVAVVETGSIVAASARLNLTQPGVTRRVQSLEQRLGAELLNRQSKPLRPTPAGRQAYELGRRVLRAVDDLVAGAAPGGEVTGELRLGLAPFVSDLALAGPVDRLQAAYPGLTLRISSAWSPALIAQVRASEIDAAAVVVKDDAGPAADLAGDRLGVECVVPVAARSLGVPRPATLADLAQRRWVLSQDGCGFRQALQAIFDRARLPFQVAVEALGSDLQLSLVARGLGIGLVKPGTLATSAYRYAVERLDVVDFRPIVHCWLVHRPPAGRFAAPLALFRQALTEALATEAAADQALASSA